MTSAKNHHQHISIFVIIILFTGATLAPATSLSTTSGSPSYEVVQEILVVDVINDILHLYDFDSINIIHFDE